jgi:glycosyltransferase involved in cell wall biosynthesis
LETKAQSKKLLIVSIWVNRWSLGSEAGVSDDYHFVRGFTAAGWEVHFLAPEGAEEANAVFPGVHTHTYENFFRRTMHRSNAFKRLYWPEKFRRVVTKRALEVAQEVQPDFILGHSHYTTETTHRCRKLLGIPSGVKLFGVMDLVHTEWPRWKYVFKNFEQLRAFRYPQDMWIVLDDGTRGDEVLRARGVPSDRIHFLPNGLDVQWGEQKFDRAGARAAFGIPDSATVVLFLARLVPSKRPQELIQAVARVEKKTEGEITFVFAGDGPERLPSLALARDLGVAHLVKFVGVVPHADIPKLMAASDLFVATGNLTNMALPTCEALICGVPVVAYDVGDTRKVVIPGETGMLVEDGNTARLADAIAGLVNDPKLRARMGRNARALARERFTGWDQRIAMELDIIGRLSPHKKNGGF